MEHQDQLKLQQRLHRLKINKIATTCWSSRSFCINCNIRRYNKPKSSVPTARLHPGNCIEKGICCAVTRVNTADSFNVIVPVFLKILHKHCFGRFTLVYNSFCSDF